MATIKDPRVIEGKESRNEMIRMYVKHRMNAHGIRYEVAIDETMKIWGLSESTISQIVKRNGNYSKRSLPPDKHLIRTIKRVFIKQSR